MAQKTDPIYQNVFNSASDGILVIDLDTGSVLVANPSAAEMHGTTQKAFTGSKLNDFVHPASLHIFNDFSKTVQRGGSFEVQAEHLRLDGSLFSVGWRALAFPYQDRTCALALLRNITKRVKAERRLEQRVGARAREQTILLEISQTLSSTLELQPNLILDQLRVLIKFTHAGLFKLEDNCLVAVAVHGIDHVRKAETIRIRLKGKDTLKALFNGRHPFRVADLHSDEPYAVFLRTLLKNGSTAFLKGVRSWMWVPLAVKERVIGGIGIAHTKKNYFTPHHAGLAMTIANQTAMTLVNAELYEHAQALAALQERQRLAQDLHDAVNQSLFSAGLIAEVLPRLWDRDPVEARQSLEDLRRLTRGAMAEMRELLAELRPSVLTDSSLGDLLRQLANAFTGRTNVPVSLTVSGEHVLPADIQVMLYRVCQEAFNNIGKHAKASNVKVDLQYEISPGQPVLSHALIGALPNGVINRVELRVCDDGSGFHIAKRAAPGHYGLGMMRERAEAAGAQFSVTSQLGKGTEIVVRCSTHSKKESP